MKMFITLDWTPKEISWRNIGYVGKPVYYEYAYIYSYSF